MCKSYLKHVLMPGYAAPQQIKPRLSPGDGFEDLPLCPAWS
jgi:hypothetical protein